MRGLGLLVFAVVAGCTPGGGMPDMKSRDLSISFPAGCTSGSKDGDETDVDCGGSCAPCGAGLMCKHGSDCDSGSCTNQVCDGPSCSDGRKNGDESDIDCGGMNCGKCADGKACNLGTDCLSGTCNNNVCKPSPCSNGMTDGAETDVDCGGGTCSACVDGKMCNVGGDCMSGTCNNNVCKGAASCMDGVKNGAETDVDCGGGMCSKCAAGKICIMNADCATGACTNGKCGAKTASFGAAASYPLVNAIPLCAAFGDWNGDNIPDAFVVSNGGIYWSFLNDGTGTLKPVEVAASLVIMVNGGYCVAGDFDRDGQGDVILGGGNNLQTVVYPGNGKGSFQGKWPLPMNIGAPYAVSDFNKDGKLDVACVNPMDRKINVALGQGDGTFPNMYWSFKLTDTLLFLSVADLNRDGKDDILVSTGDGAKLVLRALLGQGDGTFAQPINSSLPDGVSASWWGIGDFNVDGKLDVAISIDSGNQKYLAVAAGKGDGSFQMVRTYMGLVRPGHLTVADFNLDTKLDLAIATQSGLEVVSNDGAGVFGNSVLASSLPITPPFAVDLNRDKKPDVAGFAIDQQGKWTLGVVLNTTP